MKLYLSFLLIFTYSCVDAQELKYFDSVDSYEINKTNHFIDFLSFVFIEPFLEDAYVSNCNVPWLGSIINNDDYTCTATLIAAKWALTADHCGIVKNKSTLKFGPFPSECKDFGNQTGHLSFNSIDIVNEFSLDSINKKYDIKLLELEDQHNFNFPLINLETFNDSSYINDNYLLARGMPTCQSAKLRFTRMYSSKSNCRLAGGYTESNLVMYTNDGLICDIDSGGALVNSQNKAQVAILSQRCHEGEMQSPSKKCNPNSSIARFQPISQQNISDICAITGNGFNSPLICQESKIEFLKTDNFLSRF